MTLSFVPFNGGRAPRAHQAHHRPLTHAGPAALPALAPPSTPSLVSAGAVVYMTDGKGMLSRLEAHRCLPTNISLIAILLNEISLPINISLIQCLQAHVAQVA